MHNGVILARIQHVQNEMSVRCETKLQSLVTVSPWKHLGIGRDRPQTYFGMFSLGHGLMELPFGSNPPPALRATTARASWPRPSRPTLCTGYLIPRSAI